ncbi:MAG: polysaccharide biosynthesis tyrosine autokinase [Verrucomicrobiota bacterium JB022]|nr:polysaccharide biosynthesis tyrosine autokinase [Verrucomicrobiota bacterium JB022]
MADTHNNSSGWTTAPKREPKRTLQDYLLIVRERAWWAALIALVAAGLLAAYMWSQPRLYQSSTTLLFETTPERIVDIEEVVDTSLRGKEDMILQVHLEQITSRQFMQRVIDSLNQEEQTLLTRPYADEDGKTPSLASVIRQASAISPGRGAPLFRITFRHRSAEGAALLANRYAQEYIDYMGERSDLGNERALGFLRQQADELRGQIEASELKLQDYRQQHNLVSLEENQNIVLERMKELNAAVTRARVNRLNASAKVAEVEDAMQTDRNLLQIPAISEGSGVDATAAKLAEAKAERETLNTKYLERHPRMVENAQKIEGLEQMLDRQIQTRVTDLRNQLAEAQERENKLQTELASAEQEALRRDRQAIEYNVLRRQIESDQRLFDQLMSRLNETNVSSQLGNVNARIVDEAQPAGAPFTPDRNKVIASSAMLFLLILVGIPIAMEAFDNKLKTEWDVGSFLQKNFLGEIPLVKGNNPEKRAKIVLDNENPRAREYFRSIYSQIMLMSEATSPRVSIITSTLPGEGKTFVACNLASCFAKHHARTLLIDCDLRRPQINRYFEMKNDAGLIPWLERGDVPSAEQSVLDDPLLEIRQVSPYLHVLRTGGTTQEASEFFQSQKFHNLLLRLRDNYDQIIIDTPPVGGFSDALFLASQADETIFVAKHNHVNRRKVKYLLERIDHTPGRVLGVIFNQTKTSRTQQYGFYGFYDEKTYRNYYGDNKSSSQSSSLAAREPLQPETGRA